MKKKILTTQDIIEQREQAQEDIVCILDGIDDDDIVDRTCEVIVDRFNILIMKLGGKISV